MQFRTEWSVRFNSGAASFFWCNPFLSSFCPHLVCPSHRYFTVVAIVFQGAIGDEVLGNVTALLKERSMWEDTLLIYSSDNGGPSGKVSLVPSANCLQHAGDHSVK